MKAEDIRKEEAKPLIGKRILAVDVSCVNQIEFVLDDGHTFIIEGYNFHDIPAVMGRFQR